MTRIKHSQSLGWLSFKASVAEAESLLKTKYHVYEHTSGRRLIACEHYRIPTALRHVVDIVTPTLHFDVHHVKREVANSKNISARHRSQPGSITNPGRPWGGDYPKMDGRMPKKDIITKLEDCWKQITPWCLRVLYGFSPGYSANSRNPFGVVEYTPQAYVPSDLDLFFKNFSTSQVGNRPLVKSIDGGYVQQFNKSDGYTTESDLDLEYAMSLVFPQQVRNVPSRLWS